MYSQEILLCCYFERETSTLVTFGHIIPRPFFRACGFGDDVLASTTMMYTRSASADSEDEQIVKYAGRKLLLAPSLRGNLKT